MDLLGDEEEGFGPEGALHPDYQDFQDQEEDEEGDEGDFELEIYDEEAQSQQQQQQVSTKRGRSNNHYSNNSSGRGGNSSNNISHYNNGNSAGVNSTAYRYATNVSENNSHYNNGSGSAEVDYEEDYSEEDQEQEEEQEEYGYHPHRGNHQLRQHEEEEEDYPDTLQFCEAQFDDEYMEDDEEARGLPPRNYGESEDLSTDGQGTSRVTTNESGIRIVESSTILEPDDDDDEDDYYDQDYQQYDNLGEMESPIAMPVPRPVQQKKIAMNKPRKFRPEKAASESLLRQFQSNDYDYNKPNILARKLMGVPSHTVQQARPPPLMKKPNQSRQQQQQQQPKPTPVPISLESILRSQQRPSMPRLQPRSSSGLLNQSQLKIKSSHGIPPHKLTFPNNFQQKSQRVQNIQQSPSSQGSSSRLIIQQQSSPSLQSSISMIRSKAKTSLQKQQNYQYQQISSSQLRSKNGSSNNRLSAASLQQQFQLQQQQQNNGMSMTTKPLKNVPRCHVCKRTFATNQVLQRHMALHGPIATITESESGEYKCEDCFQEFENPFLLAKHMQSHNSTASSASSNPVHRCRVCYRTFTCLESLKAHSLMHDGEFKCRACRRGFPDWNSLEEHEATHKRYNCQWCEKYFMNSGNLKAHERIHTGERPYKCNDCPKAFKQLGGLQYHLKTNPNHKPQKYHKMEGEGDGEGVEEEGEGGYQGSMNYEDSGEDYEDMANSSILDMVLPTSYNNA